MPLYIPAGLARYPDTSNVQVLSTSVDISFTSSGSADPGLVPRFLGIGQSVGEDVELEGSTIQLGGEVTAYIDAVSSAPGSSFEALKFYVGERLFSVYLEWIADELTPEMKTETERVAESLIADFTTAVEPE
jgi:hypothetical protein